MSIRLGILGIGSMGRHHVRNARATDGVDLVALADPGGDRFGVAGDLPVRRGVRELIDAGIDAAIVATPTALHEEAALALADAHQQGFSAVSGCGQALAQAGIWRDFCREPVEHRAHVAA